MNTLNPQDNCTPQHGLTWLDHSSGKDDDPWLLRSDDESSHHAAFIGNGFIGCRIGEDGDAIHAIHGSGSMMAGFWGACRRKSERLEGQVDLPHWAGFCIHIGEQREKLRLLQRQQFLDLRQAIVTTTGMLGPVHIQRTNWLAREDKHIAVFSATLSNTSQDSRPIKIEIKEVFDASDLHEFDMHPPKLSDDRIIVQGTEQRLKTRLAMASQLVWSDIDPQRLKSAQLKVNQSSLSRCRYLWLNAGEEITVTRYVALAHDQDDDDPSSKVITRLEKAIANPEDLQSRHNSAWASIWQHRIEVDHPRLQRILNAGLYYLYASLRHDEYWSHGPAGLTNDAWDGTVFWDTELWTLPPLAFLQPAMALACTRYRFNTLDGALNNAEHHGESGARYAWQSAATGRECCVRPVFTEERHITSCVARGQWISAITSGDHEYLKGPGWQVIKACADYWSSRIKIDPDQSAHIRQVCGPDEDAGLVDDNAMTNASAAWTLRLAHRLAIELNETPHPDWLNLAEALVIPWDDERDLPLQMESWQHGQTIKQADTTLLIHPWRYPLDDATKQRTVDYYRAHYPPNQIMMGLAIDAIVDCQIGRPETAWECLGKLMPHIHEPYLWFTEAPNNENGCFLTGIGGLLQLLLQGFAGVYIDDERKLHFQPCLPESLNKLVIHGLCHEGKHHTLNIIRQHNTVTSELVHLNTE